jgi:hypothetical protein
MVGFDGRERVVHKRMVSRPPGEDTDLMKWRRWLFYF